MQAARRQEEIPLFCGAKGSAPGYILAETTLACYMYALRCSGWQIYAAAALLTRDDRSSQREGGDSECIALSTLEDH